MIRNPQQSRRARYPLTKECTRNHVWDPCIPRLRGIGLPGKQPQGPRILKGFLRMSVGIYIYIHLISMQVDSTCIFVCRHLSVYIICTHVCGYQYTHTFMYIYIYIDVLHLLFYFYFVRYHETPRIRPESELGAASRGLQRAGTAPHAPLGGPTKRLRRATGREKTGRLTGLNVAYEIYHICTFLCVYTYIELWV